MNLFDRLFKSSNELVEIGNQYLFGLGDFKSNYLVLINYLINNEEENTH